MKVYHRQHDKGWRKPKRRFSAPALSEQQRLALAPRSQRAVLWLAKFQNRRDSPVAVARYLAEELRVFRAYGARSLVGVIEHRWNDKHFISRMLKELGKALEDDQPVYRKEDYAIVDIVVQHPLYTIKEITAALSEQFPKQKRDTPETHWDRLEKRVRRLLKNVPRL